MVENYVPRMLETYRASVAPELQKRFSYKSAMQVPRLVKITLNVGLGEATQNPKLLDAAAAEIAAMTGQKPVDPEGQEGDRELPAAREPARSA